MTMKIFKTLACTLVLFIVSHSVVVVYPDTALANSDVTIQHAPPICIASQHPYRLSAVLANASEIDDVRLYFNIQGVSSDYLIQMRPIEKHSYAGIIPAVLKTGVIIEYRIAAYQDATEIARTPKFLTLTSAEAECPITELSETLRPIVVYTEQPIAEERGFSDKNVEWTVGSFDDAQILSTDNSKPLPEKASQTEDTSKTRSVSQESAASEKSQDADQKGTLLGLPALSTKTMLGIGLGVGAATAAGVALLSKPEETITWTIDSQNVDKKIKVEIIKTPNMQTACGTVVSNALYVTNARSESLSVTSIDYEVILTRERPSDGCDPGRIGTFAPNWAVVVPPGERALVRQWSNEVNPCSGCPYMNSRCRWNSKYIVHTTLGSGEAETEFSSEGDLCAASAASKNFSLCTPPNADVEP